VVAVRVLVVTIVHVPLDARIYERQVAALRDAGCEVTYAAPWRAQEVEPPRGLRTIDVPRSVGRKRWASLRAARRLLREEAGSHDIVILHDPELLLVSGAAGRTPVVWDVHEDVRASLVARPWIPATLRPIAGLAARALERRAERTLHLVLAEHGYRARFSADHPVVPNVPILPDEVLPPGRSRVVYLGRVARARGAEALIELGRRLRGEVDVEIIGDAERDVEPLLEAAAARGDVAWTGYLPNREALSRLRGATAGLSLLADLPNFRGSMPTKVLEYLACGVPVITTPLPLAAEVVRESAGGRVVPFGDVDAAVDAVRGLLRDDATRVDAGARGRAYVQERYSWQIEGPRFVELIRGWARARIELQPLPATPQVSVVIPARDCASSLPGAVRSALDGGAAEVVVAVGPSRDETHAVAQRLADDNDEVHVVDNPTGRTPAGLNAAIRASRGDVIARLDAHATLSPDYLERAVSTLRRTGAANVGGRQRPVGRGAFGEAVAAVMTSPAGAGGAAYRTGQSAGAVDTVYLGVFRREALDAVGGFDERMVRNQDYELNVRIREAGGTVWFDPELAVDYGPRERIADLARQYLQYGRWRRVTLRLHPGSLRARQLAAPALVLGLLGGVIVAAAFGAWWPLGAVGGAYLLAVVVAAVQAAPSARLVLATALAFVVVHLSWGSGFLLGPPSGALDGDARDGERT
jgi:glycosyltransferase involved in cell wall biosynthesis/GT2 family glycosyltransferase